MVPMLKGEALERNWGLSGEFLSGEALSRNYQVKAHAAIRRSSGRLAQLRWRNFHIGPQYRLDPVCEDELDKELTLHYRPIKRPALNVTAMETRTPS